MRPIFSALVLSSLLFLAPPVAVAQTSGVTFPGMLNGGNYTSALGVSADGTVVVGDATDGSAHNADRAFRWTQATGLVSLGVLSGGNFSSARGVSADGSVVVGAASDASGNQRAFRWTQATGLVSLGVLSGGNFSYATGVSADGSVVVGTAPDAANHLHAFRWTQSSGMVSLGTLNGGNADAHGVSADGTVVVGVAGDGSLTVVSGSLSHTPSRAFRWTQATGLVSLGVLNGGSYSAANGVSGDGSVVVGTADDGALGNYRAFRWTQAGGMTSLEVLSGSSSSFGTAISTDGTVIVGWCESPTPAYSSRAFRWTQAGGMQSVADWLRAAGVTVANDAAMGYATAINSDGSVVVGLDQARKEAYIARVATIGSGMITLSDLSRSLALASVTGNSVLTAGQLLMDGAHSRPLARRVPASRRTFWVAGDFGADNYGDRDGDVALAEVGLGWNTGPVQINGSVGQTRTRQNIAGSGNARTSGTYLMLEGLIPLNASDERGLWAVLGGYRQWGDAETRREYPNAGLPDASTGRPSTESWGLRGRLEWLNATKLGGVALSPYIGVSHVRATVDSYTETGGGFPARFNGRTENNTELHLGADATVPIGTVRVIGGLEAVHRLQTNGTVTTGEIIGLFGFAVPGQTYRRDWLRASLGAEGRIGGGVAAATLNVTTRGEAPSVWLALSWRLAF